MQSPDRARLAERLERGELLCASPTLPGTVGLSRALATLGGVRGLEPVAGAYAIARAISPSEHVVFVLIDGLGMNLIEALPEDAFLRRHVAMELRAVVPSSTAPALTSLATGAWPAQHGVPGWWSWLPEQGIAATILPFVERFSRRPLGELGVAPTEAFPCVPLTGRYSRDVRAFFPRVIAGSVYSGYVCDGTPIEPYDTLRGAVEMVAARVHAASGPTYSYLYYPDLDAAEHRHGPSSREAAAELDRAGRELARLAELLTGRARVVISADHGQITPSEDASRVLREGDPLLGLLRTPPTGEPRLPRFHVKPGGAEPFARAFRGRFGEAFALLRADEAQAIDLFGPGKASAVSRARGGDFVAVPLGDAVLRYERDAAQLGEHGGLSPDEMRIPLIVA